MRKLLLNAALAAASLAIVNSGYALQKTAARMTDTGRADAWNAGSTCSVAYYNTCTGWIWIWSGWASGDMVGVSFDNCCGGAGTLDTNWLFAWTGAPSGYGFTGTIEVLSSDAGRCPSGSVIASQPYLPVSGWNQYVWGADVTGPFVIRATHGTTSLPNPTAYASDHPAAGPTGPAACGACFPTTRANHSFFYGTVGSALCPGSALNDGVCDSQLLWDAQLSNCPVSVDAASWGEIKNLYR